MVFINNSSPEGSIALAIVKDCMLNKEARRKEQGVSHHNEALIMERKGRASIGTPDLTWMVAMLNYGKDPSPEVADVIIVANGATLKKTIDCQRRRSQRTNQAIIPIRIMRRQP